MRILPLLALIVACGPRTGGTGATGVPTGTPAGSAGSTVRIMSWNIESLGTQGSAEYIALLEIIARIDPDVLGLNEIDEFEADAIKTLAAEFGYDTVVAPTENPFGDLKNAILSRLPVSAQVVHRSADLSGDAQANDMTRKPVSVTLAGSDVTIVANHCKSGFDDIDEFRRSVDAIRMAQAGGGGRAVVMGDINQEVDEPQDQPLTFGSIPNGAPGDYYLGADLWDRMTTSGLDNGPFPHFEQAGLKVVPAAQLDGRLATRDSSGRRIDYILVGSELVSGVVGAEVYDSRDEQLGPGLPKSGPQPARLSSLEASDHFPVFIDLAL